VYTQIASNKRKTILLMIGFVLFIYGFGLILSKALGKPGLVVGMTVFAVIYAFFSYYASARVALALSGARAIEKKDAPELYRIVENLSITAGLPMPKVYVMNDPALNAFATGRDPKHAAVAVTTGLMETLNSNELEGVIAHELSHVGNYDIRLMAVVLVLVTVISTLSNLFFHLNFWGDDDDSQGNAVLMIIGLVMAIIAPLVATLMQLAVSRKREFLADASGVLLTRYPDGLAGALQKIAASERPLKTANTATAHLFLANPFKRGAGGIAKLFSTHPPIEERIARLQQMETRP
jgi:heat shock protein HtpX